MIRFHVHQTHDGLEHVRVTEHDVQIAEVAAEPTLEAIAAALSTAAGMRLAVATAGAAVEQA